jgi:hypothetical protein
VVAGREFFCVGYILKSAARSGRFPEQAGGGAARHVTPHCENPPEADHDQARPAHTSRFNSEYAAPTKESVPTSTYFLKALSGSPQLQIGVFTDTALVKERHYLLGLQV